MRRRPQAPQHPRVTIISPHPDDDVIGCGGVLQRLTAIGARCCIVYVTDGSASHVQSKRFPAPILRDLREREAQAAVSALGVRAKTIFLREPDGKLSVLEATQREAAVTALARIIERQRTQLLFVPWLRDPHPDHVATACLVQAALAKIARKPHARKPQTFMYGVWLAVRGTAAEQPDPALYARCDVRLTPLEVGRKRAAILAHRSQSGDLVDDDPDGFRIDEPLLAQWLTPVERFYRRVRDGRGSREFHDQVTPARAALGWHRLGF